MANDMLSKLKARLPLRVVVPFFVPACWLHQRGNIMSKKFEIPWVLSNKRIDDEGYEAAFKASQKHGKCLSKAESDLATARDLAETLQSYLAETHIDECFTAGSIVDLIEKRINKARDRLDGHSSQYHNLFVAYFDLKVEGGAS